MSGAMSSVDWSNHLPLIEVAVIVPVLGSRSSPRGTRSVIK